MKDQCYKYVRHQIRQLREKVEVEEINQQQLIEPPKKIQQRKKHLLQI